MDEVPWTDNRLRKARRGAWPAVAGVLEDAVKALSSGEALDLHRAQFLAEVLGRLQLPGLKSLFERAEKDLLERTPLPETDASDLADFLAPIAKELRRATERKAQYLEENPPKRGGLLAPIPELSHFLRLSPDLKHGFGLSRAKSQGGRPEKEETPSEVFDLYELLLAYGMRPTHAQALLASRFGVTTRTLQRRLKEGEAKIARWGKLPWEPYLKARLAVAVREAREKGASEEKSLEAVAYDFGLVAGYLGVSAGARAVSQAVELCRENAESWACVPLATAAHEIGERRAPHVRRLPERSDEADAVDWGANRRAIFGLGPTPEDVAQLRAYAVREGEGLFVVSGVSRSIFDTAPGSNAVMEVEKELGLPTSLIVASCQRRIDYRELAASQAYEER